MAYLAPSALKVQSVLLESQVLPAPMEGRVLVESVAPPDGAVKRAMMAGMASVAPTAKGALWASQAIEVHKVSVANLVPTDGKARRERKVTGDGTAPKECKAQLVRQARKDPEDRLEIPNTSKRK